jgi:cystathionine gamma-synthase
MHPETKAIHSGLDVFSKTPAVVPPMHPSTVFEHSEKGFQMGDLNYARYSNPNRLHWEALLASMEEGTNCAAFSSGVAAAEAIFKSLNPDDHVLMPADVYAGNRSLMNKVMKPWNLEVDYIDMVNPENVSRALKDNSRLIWIETPSNPLLNITDIQAICKIAQDNDILTCVDNTWPTPVNQLPLELGADLVLHSTTKYFGGHSDILGGAVIAPEGSELFPRIREIQQVAGAVPSPRDCWLLARSTRTLIYRMRGHNEHAKLLSQFLQDHSRVEKVCYPGLPNHPGHEIAQKQMSDYGGMISFMIDGDETDALGIVANSSLIERASSLGGVESTWEHRRSSEGEGSVAPENLIRLSVGLEHPEDLIEDVEGALNS